MYQVTIRGPDGSEVHHSLGADEGIVFGRDDTCDVVLPSKRVSRRHARFFSENDALFCEDLDSQNGVFVGGARLQGVQEIRPGPTIEIGEFQVRIRKIDTVAERAAQAKIVKAHLQGVGASAGKSVDLPSVRGVVGREPSSDVPVPDDSVSRQHAELVADQAGLYLIRDLGSSNGTFINGERLKPGVDAPLNHKDQVRFGDTTWVFIAGANARRPAGNERVKKLALFGGAGLVLLFVVLFALKPSETGESQSYVDDAAAEVNEAIGRGQAAADQERFEEAVQAFKDALRADPINTDARLLLRKAEGELENARHFEQARKKAEVGNDAEAYALYLKIDPSSRSFARARLRARDLTAALARKDEPACKQAGAKRDWAGVLTVCTRYLDYTCHRKIDEEIEKLVRSAEKATKAPTAWQCPDSLAAWFGTGGTVDVDKALENAYPDQALRAAVASYVKGDFAAAQRTAQGLRQGANAARATEVYEALMLIDGRVKEGQSALIRDNLRDAEAPFKIALELDQKLLAGTSLESFQARQTRQTLAKRFYDAGREHFDRSRHSDAFRAWAKGAEFAPRDGMLLDGLNRLEKVAERMAADGDCADINAALNLVRDGRPLREKILEARDAACP